ncbi:MAG: RICIN domain-containing protein [Bacteroidales bacterium]|nr:RICIN domain-containing protein [Bacteroidales bacterium]
MIRFFTVTVGVFCLGFSVHADDPIAEIVDGAKYRIINRKSDLALDVMDRSMDKGAAIIQAKPDSASNSQIWQVVKSNVGHKIINYHSVRAVDVRDGRMKRVGQMIWQWDIHGGEAQQWYFKKYQNKGYVIYASGGLALAPQGGSKDVGAKIVQLRWANSSAQVWDFVPVSGVKVLKK